MSPYPAQKEAAILLRTRPEEVAAVDGISSHAHDLYKTLPGENEGAQGVEELETAQVHPEHFIAAPLLPGEGFPVHIHHHEQGIQHNHPAHTRLQRLAHG